MVDEVAPVEVEVEVVVVDGVRVGVVVDAQTSGGVAFCWPTCTPVVRYVSVLGAFW